MQLMSSGTSNNIIDSDGVDRRVGSLILFEIFVYLHVLIICNNKKAVHDDVGGFAKKRKTTCQ